MVSKPPAVPPVVSKSDGTAAAVSPSSDETVDFAALVRELRAALREVSEQRLAVQRRGDKIKELCLYDRQRAIAQTVDSAEQAQTGWEAAEKRGDATVAKSERARAKQAAELGRSLRTAAESCIGEELRGASRPTAVTTSGPGRLDDPQAGPAERTQPNLARLELPSRPNPASAFRPSR